MFRAVIYFGLVAFALSSKGNALLQLALASSIISICSKTEEPFSKLSRSRAAVLLGA